VELYARVRQAAGLIVWDQPGIFPFYQNSNLRQTLRLLGSLNGLIARNKTGAQPVNFQAGESIIYAQPLPARFHDLLHRPSNEDGFTPRQAKTCNIG